MPTGERVGEYFTRGPADEQLRPPRHPVTEAERNESVDRDTVRRVILAQAEILVDAVLNTSPDRNINTPMLIEALVRNVLPTVEAFRERKRMRFLTRLDERIAKPD